MSEPATASFARRLLATRTARVAALVLGLFVSLAVLAPLIANDKPYWMRAVDFGAYEEARASLVPVTEAWDELRRGGEAQYDARRPDGAKQTWARAVASERAAIDVRVRTMRKYVDPADAQHVEELDELDSAKGRLIDEVDDPVGLARLIAAAFDPTATRAPKGYDPSRGGSTWRRVQLRSVSTAPLFAALTPLDAGLIAAWLAGILAILFLRSRRARIGVPLAFALVVALAWRPIVGADAGPVSIKDAIDRGDLRVERAWFPPIPMGYAETNLAEAFRPPTWRESSRMRPSGGYEREDPRKDRFAPLPVPVRVSAFEPELNAWNRHLLGTDALGRDLLARLVWGARASLFVGFASAILLTAIGVALGAWAGWRGGTADWLISRTIELVLCFPAFVLVLCTMFFVDPRVVPPIVSVAVVIGIVGWTGVARLVRAECLRVRELEFVAAARALGIAEPRILWRHVLPNAIQPAIIAFSFAIGTAILTESALSFLGFGVEAPVPSWGALVTGASSSLDHAWVWVFPGVCIFAVVAGSNLLGEALRDALDPRHGR
jgi:peptide/nickel transport system permease protein